jgi:hypothetical protein
LCPGDAVPGLRAGPVAVEHDDLDDASAPVDHRLAHSVSVLSDEQVRWLPRRDGYDLLTPTADFYVIDSRLVAFNFNAGDGTSLREYEFVSDPMRVGPVVASFEQVWNRATEHADYKPAR